MKNYSENLITREISTPDTTQVSHLSLGFIGLGWIGTNRMKALLDSNLAKAAAICEPCEENAHTALTSCPEALQLASPEEVCKHPDVEAVVIASPSAMHAEQAMMALKAGKAVFVQKPLGRNAAEVRELIETAAKADCLLGVDLSYRYTTAYKKVKQLVHQDQLGEVYAVDLVFHNAYGPNKEWFYQIEKSGGGCLMDLGVHLLDMALGALGFPETEVSCSHLYHKGKKLGANPQVAEDYAQATLQAGNVHINLQCSWHLPAGQEAEIQARFYGTEASAVFRNINGSFYDFEAILNTGTHSDILVSSPDNWGGRAGVAWAKKLMSGDGFNPKDANEFLQLTELMDRIYER